MYCKCYCSMNRSRSMDSTSREGEHSRISSYDSGNIPVLTSHSVIDPQYYDYCCQSSGYQQDFCSSDYGDTMDYHGSYNGHFHDPYSGYQLSSNHHRSRYGQYEQCYETSHDDYHNSRCDVQGHGHRCQHDHDVFPIQHSPTLQAEYGLRQRHDVMGMDPDMSRIMMYPLSSIPLPIMYNMENLDSIHQSLMYPLITFCLHINL